MRVGKLEAGFRLRKNLFPPLKTKSKRLSFGITSSLHRKPHYDSHFAVEINRSKYHDCMPSSLGGVKAHVRAHRILLYILHILFGEKMRNHEGSCSFLKFFESNSIFRYFLSDTTISSDFDALAD